MFALRGSTPMREPVIVFSLPLAALPCLSQRKVTPHDRGYSFDLNEKKLFGTAVITVGNFQSRDTLRLLLKGLMKVKSDEKINSAEQLFTDFEHP